MYRTRLQESFKVLMYGATVGATSSEVSATLKLCHHPHRFFVILLSAQFAWASLFNKNPLHILFWHCSLKSMHYSVTSGLSFCLLMEQCRLKGAITNLGSALPSEAQPTSKRERVSAHWIFPLTRHVIRPQGAGQLQVPGLSLHLPFAEGGFLFFHLPWYFTWYFRS